MTEDEAVAILTEQLTSEQGFVAKLRGGAGIDRQGVAVVMEAMQVLAKLYADSTSLPKRVAAPMQEVFSIAECSLHYPEQHQEIVDLAMGLMDQVDRLCSVQSETMSEAEAVAVVYGHAIALPSVALLMRHGESLAVGWEREMHTALDALALAWRDRTEVPKFIARPMLEFGDLVHDFAHLYPERQQASLERTAEELRAQVRRCLR